MTEMMDENLADLIDSLWDFHDPAASEQRFQHAASQMSDDALRGKLLTQLARAQGLQRRFDEAHATLDEAERIVARPLAEGRDRSAQTMLLLERGRVFNSSGEAEVARPLFQQAWELARDDDGQSQAGCDALAVDAAHMLAIITDGDESVRWNELALDAAEASSDPRAHRWRASLLNNLGWTYHDRGDFDRALDCFERALAARLERNQPREILIARWAVARCMRSLGRIEEAIERQRELIGEWEALGAQDGFVHEELGECLLQMQEPEQAKPHFAAAYELLRRDPWLCDHEAARLARLAKLGGCE